ncbi:TIGR02444 family protein [Marinivivus vitaminiproducens]|uniref:TIGR02444 family protein n=1 Tax=Marinivivus vitaminiproducens TaxID=3035935 RepID=UPI0027A0B488|nr:TIGR02444 family protein [Geminicoccaceae bacterium SCSIO 64248]
MTKGRACLWPFACAFYARPGVKDRLLDLQDRHGADVPLLLAVLWLASGGAALGGSRVQRLRAISTPVQLGVIRPLRASRTALKSLFTAAADPMPQAVRLRKTVLAVELDAERFVLELMEREAEAWFAEPLEDGARAEDALSAAVGSQDCEVRRALQDLLRAAHDLHIPF